MRRSDQQAPISRRATFGLFPRAEALPPPVYRDFVDMLFSMRLPIFGLGAVFVGVATLAAYELGDAVFAALALLGALTTVVRLFVLSAYRRTGPAADFEQLKRWERRYAIGNYAFAMLLGVLNVNALLHQFPLLHLLTVSLMFSFGAGVVSRISVRPAVCVLSVLLATVPTVVALAFHALSGATTSLNTELYAIEALLVAMITGLCLQTVAHLYRSAVEHHTARHDMALLAKHDALTGLANRLLLREGFQSSIATAQRRGSRLAVHFLDLDGFKAINDGHGHPAGDAVLGQVARRLEATVRSGDMIARLGGDEFVVLQTDVVHQDEAEMLARRIVRELSAPYEVDGVAMRISTSIGIAMAPQFGMDLERLLACADSALYRAKTGGKARAKFCTDHDAAAAKLAA